MNTHPDQWKKRPVKVAGHTDALRVVSLQSNCGDIKDGIAFAFDRQGAWVVSFDDLRDIVEAAQALKDKTP